MNDDIEFMIEQLGEPKTVHPAEDSIFEGIGFPFSDNYKHLLSEYGRFNFSDGRLQVVAPEDLQTIIDLIFSEDKDFGESEAIFSYAYSAFGEINFWHRDHRSGEIDLLRGTVTCHDLTNESTAPPVMPVAAMDTPFYLEKEDYDFHDEDGKPMFKRARKKLGEIEFLECYGFVPALAFGGEPQVGNLKKMPALEHFSILAQATEFTLMKSISPFELEAVRSIGA